MDRHQNDRADKVAPIAKAACRRTLAVIAIWTAAANWVRRRSNCDEEAVAGTVLVDDDDRGSHRGDDEDAVDSVTGIADR